MQQRCFIQISTKSPAKLLVPFRESTVFFEAIPSVLDHSVNFNIKISIKTAHVSRLSISCDYVAFQVSMVRLIKNCKIERPDLLFLIVFISFYISRYRFSQIFRTSFNIICKKYFCHKFSFLMDSINPPSHPL